jgi:transcriptional regulator with XRE-family HTH domain
MNASVQKAARALRKARLKSDISLTDMAKRVGIGKTHLCNVEYGKVKPSDRLVRAICAELQISPDDIICLSGRIPDDVVEFIATHPELLGRIRKEMEVI